MSCKCAKFHSFIIKGTIFTPNCWTTHGNCKQVACVSEIERVSRTSEYICYIHAETFIVVLCLTVFFKNSKMTLPLQDVNF